MKKCARILAVLLAAALLLSGCEWVDKAKEYSGVFSDALEAQKNPNQTKTYANAGVSFELPNDFLDCTGTELAKEYPFLYANEEIGILGVQENKVELFESFGEMDKMGYAELIAQLYNLDVTPTTKDGQVTMTYESASDDGTMKTYLCIIFETEEDFWNIQCYCNSESYDQMQETLWGYLTTAQFD